MSLLAVGISHQSAPVALLERFAMAADDRVKALHELVASDHVSEALVLATCNRVEVFAEVERFHGGVTDVSRVLARQAEAKGLESLQTKKLIKRGTKDKTSGSYRYSVSKAGEKHLAMPAPAVAAQVDFAVHGDQVALQDIALVLDRAIGVLAEAVAADGQDHPQRGIGPQREHRLPPE